MNKFQNDLTQGSVVKQLLKFATPFLLSNLLQALYNMADMLIVGYFCGMVGTSAVSLGGQVTILLINLVSGLAVGGTVLIAQHMGAGRQKEMERTIGTMFTLYAIVGLALTVIMEMLSPLILRLISAPPQSFAGALSYLRICMGGTLFVCGYNAVSAVLRGMGDSRHPLLFVAVATVVNVVLDIVFVGGFGWGPAGAAWATIMAQALSLLLSIAFLRKRDFVFDFHPRSFRMDKTIAKQLITLGLPASLQGTLVSLSFMFLTSIANGLAGLIGSNAVGIAGKINSVAILPSMAMQVSVSAMAGQNLGAGKPKRARQTMLAAMGISLLVSTLMFAAVQLFPTQLVSLFLGTSNETISPEMLQEGIRQSAAYLQCISIDYLITSVLFCINGLAIGAGHTFFCLCSACISSLIVRIPAAYLLGQWLGLRGVGLAAPAASVVSIVIGVIYLSTGKWKTPVLHDRLPAEGA